MSGPDHLVLVRHGESEGNVISKSLTRGTENRITLTLEELGRHSGAEWRLTPKGVQQAQVAGEWIKEHIVARYGLPGFDKYFYSTHRRTYETAGHLSIDGAIWEHDSRLRERSWGEVEGFGGAEEHRRLYPLNYQLMQNDPLHWIPPGGESILQVADTRVRAFLDGLQQMDLKSALASTHGEWIWASRLVLEYMLSEDWHRYIKDPSKKIHNGQVVHYTKIDPENNKVADRYRWVRSVCPSLNYEEGSWEEFEQEYLTNDEMIARAETLPRLFD
ncbi:MAG TPA: histidine phosphatase family protein [Candidatus Saccharimonadales bacterium]|nr:histidine phosphatase family protein [Candidatus Saccharimonadales bacterium]